MAKANYARRRRNAFLAAIAMAVVFIVIVIIMIVSIANKGKKKGGNTDLPTFTANNTQTAFIPTFAPSSTTPPANLPTDGTSTPTAPADVTPSVSGTVMYVTGDGVNVREEASTTSDKITSLSKGTSVTAYDKANGFYQVKLSNGKMGYISENYLSKENPSTSTTPSTSPSTTPDTSKSSKKYVIGDKVNVRSSASTSSQVLTQLTKGTEVTAYTTVGDWTYIQYSSGKYGYISKNYLADNASNASPSSTASSTAPTSPTPTAGPTDRTYTSFTQFGISDAIASIADNSEYLQMAKSLTGWTNNENEENGKSYYRFTTKEGSRVSEFYIVYTGTRETPKSVTLVETYP